MRLDLDTRPNSVGRVILLRRIGRESSLKIGLDLNTRPNSVGRVILLRRIGREIVTSKEQNNCRHEMFTVYILKSVMHEIHYVGQTQSLETRFEHHNSSRAKWTKRYQPWEIVFERSCATRSDAMKLEKRIKVQGVKRFLSSLKTGN